MAYEDAVARVREAGEWIADNAEVICGSESALLGELHVSFTLESIHRPPDVHIERTHHTRKGREKQLPAPLA